ncbi:hypothetical protein FRC12_022558, partial [Ceratobasidium sp. 428]
MSSKPQKKTGTPARQLRRPVAKYAFDPPPANGFAGGTVGGTSFSEWGWVGTEVQSADGIGPQHRATACGFRKHICKNKQAPTKAPTQQAAPHDAEDEVVVISDDEPECSVKTCKNNPNCCNYLGQGKWLNESKSSARKLFLEAAGLGPDPQDESRAVDRPVGLKESPMYQLQTTFGMLQEGTKKAFNPVKLVERLGIRTAEQQDAQEFSKLFMSHLDNEFKKQQDVPLQSLVTDQFEGKQVYGTRCTRCNKSSEHQSSFLELEISLT